MMRKHISSAASIVCPMCDEKKCVGKDNCKQISDYIKTKLVDLGQFNRVEIDPVSYEKAVCYVGLPVKLGQKLYTIPRSAIREWTVAGVWVSADPKCSYIHVYWEQNGHHMSSLAVNFSDIGRTFFFSRAEAEAALHGNTKGE